MTHNYSSPTSVSAKVTITELDCNPPQCDNYICTFRHMAETETPVRHPVAVIQNLVIFVFSSRHVYL